MTTKKKYELWMTIDSMEAAKQAAQQGTVAALFVAIITAIVASISMALGGLGEGMPQINAWAFWDVGMFVAVAIGIHKLSRIAAVAGLLLYGIGQILIRVSNPNLSASGLVMAFFLTLAFANSVRGTFAYHRFRRDRLL